jgi:hypothetical protein
MLKTHYTMAVLLFLLQNFAQASAPTTLGEMISEFNQAGAPTFAELPNTITGRFPTTTDSPRTPFFRTAR